MRNAIRMGIDHGLVNILSDFLKDRKNIVSVDGQFSEWRTVNRGVGQGTVQGPIIFLIATAFMPLHEPHVSYADDTTFIFNGYHDVGSIREKIELLGDEYANLGLDLNPAKTVIMQVGGKISHPDVHDKLKILGVQLEANIGVCNYVRGKCRSLTAGIYAIRRIASDLGLSIYQCDVLFKQLAVSRLFYAVEFWWPLLRKSDKIVIQRVIHKAKTNGVLLSTFNVESVVLNRQLALFKKLCSDGYFCRYAPNLAHSGRRYLAPKITSERERKFFMNYMQFYCINNKLLLQNLRPRYV